MADYKFIKDYTYKTGSTCPEGMLGCMPEIITFKKGDILAGLSNNLSKDGKTVTSFQGNFSYIIPIEYLVSTDLVNQPVINSPAKEVLSQDKEDNFWRSLGVKTSGMIKPKVKGRFYLVVVLVAGYFAYKKFKK